MGLASLCASNVHLQEQHLVHNKCFISMGGHWYFTGSLSMLPEKKYNKESNQPSLFLTPGPGLLPCVRGALGFEG